MGHVDLESLFVDRQAPLPRHRRGNDIMDFDKLNFYFLDSFSIDTVIPPTILYTVAVPFVMLNSSSGGDYTSQWNAHFNNESSDR